MGDQDHAAGVVLQELLQPRHRLSASRWLVGSSSSRMSGFDSSSLVSATRRSSPPDSLVTSASPGGQRNASSACFDLRVEIPQAAGVDLVLQLGHLVGGFVGVVGGDLVVAIDHGLLLSDALHGIAEHVLGLVELRLLRQVADLDAVGRPRLAEEIVGGAGHDLQQRRFAGAVEADDADLGARIERQVDVLQHLLAARIGLGQLVHVIDELRVRHGAHSLGRCKRGEFARL